ncbi:MAG: molybdate ABC transporter substrate-binding protein, partial [Spirochaetaceae bacterium]|nr:molybdate ABC transporter substrate-binding protein [Spirochaetaceae bacterium]
MDKKKIGFVVFAAAFMISAAQGAVFASSRKEKPASGPAGQEPVKILVAAAASLKNAYDKDLIPLFQQKYPWITVEGTY